MRKVKEEPYPHFVNEVKRNSPLPHFHLFGLPVFSVLISNPIYTFLQSSSCLIFLPVFFTLQRQITSNNMMACSRLRDSSLEEMRAPLRRFIYFAISSLLCSSDCYFLFHKGPSGKQASSLWLLHQATHSSLQHIGHNKTSLQSFRQTITLIRELGFNMMYLIDPWMFSVHDTSQVTLLSCRTSFHLCPGGGGGTLESLKWAKQVFILNGYKQEGRTFQKWKTRLQKEKP